MITHPNINAIQVLLADSQHAMLQGQFDKALSGAEMAVSAEPRGPDAHCQLGNIRLAMGRADLAVKHFETALRLNAHHPLALANFGHACLRLGKLVPAQRALESSVAATPGNGLAWRDLGMAREQQGDYTQAHSAFGKAKELLPTDHMVADACWRTEPFWWAAPKGRRVQLRRWQPGDEPFLQRCWQDSNFMERYNLNLGYSIDIQQRFLAHLPIAICRSPILNESLDWLILDRDSQPLGLLSLTNIDAVHKRAEFLIGFPASPDAGLALEASLLAMKFAFDVAGFNKMTSSVYASNAIAQANTLHLGFEQEGLLRAHMLHPLTGAAIDLFLNGLTKAMYHSNRRLQQLTNRMISSAQPR